MKAFSGNRTHIMLVLESEERLKTYSLVIKQPLNFVTAYRGFGEALRMINTDKPDLVICNPFPDENRAEGFSFLNKIKALNRSIKILVLTDIYDEEIIIKTFKEGASGFVLYSSGLGEIINAINEIGMNGAPMSREIAACLVNSYQISAENPLSKREQDVLREVSTGKSYFYIAEELNISVDTVRTHVQHIFEKLNVRNKSEAVIKAKINKLV